MRTISDFFAPTTLAIRAGVINGQLRQTKAWRRLGKCGSGTGFGAVPLGSSEMGMEDDPAAASAMVGPKDDAREKLPSAAELVLMKLRLDQPAGCLFIANSPGPGFATESASVAVLHASQDAAGHF